MPHSSTELNAWLLMIRAIYKTMPTMVRCGNLNWIQLDGYIWKRKDKIFLSKFKMALDYISGLRATDTVKYKAIPLVDRKSVV